MLGLILNIVMSLEQMESATADMFCSKSFGRHYDSGRQNAAHVGMVRSNLAPFVRVNLRGSAWKGESVKKSPVDNEISGREARGSELAGVANANLSDARPGNRTSVAVLMEVEGYGSLSRSVVTISVLYPIFLSCLLKILRDEAIPQALHLTDSLPIDCLAMFLSLFINSFGHGQVMKTVLLYKKSILEGQELWSFLF